MCLHCNEGQNQGLPVFGSVNLVGGQWTYLSGTRACHKALPVYGPRRYLADDIDIDHWMAVRRLDWAATVTGEMCFSCQLCTSLRRISRF